MTGSVEHRTVGIVVSLITVASKVLVVVVALLTERAYQVLTGLALRYRVTLHQHIVRYLSGWSRHHEALTMRHNQPESELKHN